MAQHLETPSDGSSFHQPLTEMLKVACLKLSLTVQNYLLRLSMAYGTASGISAAVIAVCDITYSRHKVLVHPSQVNNKC